MMKEEDDFRDRPKKIVSVRLKTDISAAVRCPLPVDFMKYCACSWAFKRIGKTGVGY